MGKDISAHLRFHPSFESTIGISSLKYLLTTALRELREKLYKLYKITLQKQATDKILARATASIPPYLLEIFFRFWHW